MAGKGYGQPAGSEPTQVTLYPLPSTYNPQVLTSTRQARPTTLTSCIGGSQMRSVLLVVVLGSAAACANDMTAPGVPPAPSNSLVATEANAPGGRWAFGRRGFGMAGPFFAARRPPDNLQLTDSQQAQIKTLITAFRTAHRDDLQSLATAMKQAHAARVAGQTAEQRRALFAQTAAQTAPARQRLAAAHKQLAADIQQVLTTDQRAWLASHHPSFRHGARPKRNA